MDVERVERGEGIVRGACRIEILGTTDILGAGISSWNWGGSSVRMSGTWISPVGVGMCKGKDWRGVKWDMRLVNAWSLNET